MQSVSFFMPFCSTITIRTSARASELEPVQRMVLCSPNALRLSPLTLITAILAPFYLTIDLTRSTTVVWVTAPYIIE
jgi:hypothetical protein